MQPIYQSSILELPYLISNVVYFILGALASGILLYGMSMLYGATGSLDLGEIKSFSGAQRDDILLIFGLVFVLVGIGIKMGVSCGGDL